MSNARLEILKMVAEGKISPEDGDRLLAALKEGASPGAEPETSAGPGPRDTHPPDPKRDAYRADQEHRHAGGGRSRDGFRSATENLGRAFEDAAGAVRVAAADGMRAFQKVFDEHRPGTELVQLEGNAFAVAAGATLRIQPAVRLSVGGGSAGGTVTVRATEGDAVRVLRGSAVEVHRYENEYIVTWAKSSLELELPSAVALLVARGIGGNVSVYGFAGELRVDALGGSVIVDGPVQPLRISSVGGTVRVTDLGLTSGSSSITVTGGDVHISIAPEASLELRATASFGGGLELPPGSTHTTGRTRHRGTCVFGERSGRLKVDTVAGWIRVRDPYERATGHPDPESWWDEQVNQRDEPTRPERSSDSASPYAEGLERDSVPPPPIPTPPVPTPPTSTPRVPTPPNPAASEGNPPTSPRDVAGEAMGDSGIAAEVFGRTSRRTRTGSGEATNRPDGAELDPHREEERP